MGRVGTVIGQTGTTVLSVDKVKYKATKKRTVRYQTVKLGAIGYWTFAVGPFHSPYYGASGYGTSKRASIEALRNNLSDNYGYHGHVLLSDVDEADTVGIIDPRLIGHDQLAVPITESQVDRFIGTDRYVAHAIFAR